MPETSADRNKKRSPDGRRLRTIVGRPVSELAVRVAAPAGGHAVGVDVTGMPCTRAQSLNISRHETLPEFDWDVPPFEHRENFGNTQGLTKRLFVAPEHPHNLEAEVQHGSSRMPRVERLRLKP